MFERVKHKVEHENGCKSYVVFTGQLSTTLEECIEHGVRLFQNEPQGGVGVLINYNGVTFPLEYGMTTNDAKARYEAAKNNVQSLYEDDGNSMGLD